MSDSEKETVIVGESTSALIRQQEQTISDAQEKKRIAIQSFLDGQGISKEIVGMEQTKQGRVKLKLASEDDE